MAKISSADQHSIDLTKHYYDAILKFAETLANSSVIDTKLYEKIMKIIPGDLQCKLRLVPDEKLSSRLSHLFEIARIMRDQPRLGPYKRYSLISVEGSNRQYPFDMDLILEDDDTGLLVCIDVTSSKSSTIQRNKFDTIESILKHNNMPKSVPYVHVFQAVEIPVRIDTPFKSKEPGTQALRVLEEFASSHPKIREKINLECTKLHSMVVDELTQIDVAEADKAFKEADHSKKFVDDCLELVQKQSDKESFYLMNEAKKEGEPEYLNAVINMAEKAGKIKFAPRYDAAIKDTTRDLTTMLESLKANPLANALREAMRFDRVVCMINEGSFELLSEFPCDSNANSLPLTSKYLVCAKRLSDHVFQIMFHPDMMDDKLRRVLLHNVPKKDKSFKGTTNKSGYELAEHLINQATMKMREERDYLMTIASESPLECVWNKISTISDLASNDLENFGRSSASMLSATVQLTKAIKLGAVMSHEYEITKTIAASLKARPKDNTYYVGVNGSYSSISIVKMNSTLDSFKTCAHSVIYKPDRRKLSSTLRYKHSVHNGVAQSHFYSIDSNQLAYQLRFPMIFTALATWEIENNMKKGAISNDRLPAILYNSYAHAAVNKDPFAQASEQTRYFYMSSIGYGAKGADLLDKVDFLRCTSSWEVLYMLRMFKMGLCLSALKSSNRLGELAEKSIGDSSSELSVCFPHADKPSRNFSQTVSSMYLCNVYNKFRSYHEVSEAICFTEIMAERDIYEKAIKEDLEAVIGFSNETITAFSQGRLHFLDYLTNGNFLKNEFRMCKRLTSEGPKRYSGNIPMIIGSTITNANMNNKIMEEIYTAVGKSPIDACTMRGGMDRGSSTKDKQGIRAASGIVEELISDMGFTIKDVNKSPLGSVFLFDRITEKYYHFSLFSKAVMQFIMETEPYRYRIVQKDQKGHREISVLNASFRLGAMFVETASKIFSTTIGDVDIVNNPEKDMIVEQEIKRAFTEKKAKKSKSKFYWYFDNSDQKRWGPNHNVNFFAGTLYGFLRNDVGFFKLCLAVLDKVFDKRAKYPEGLIDLVDKKGLTSSNSEPIHKFLKDYSANIKNGIYEELMAASMCQGILHGTSSLQHGNKAKTGEIVMHKRFPGSVISSFTTSDDALRINKIPMTFDRQYVMKFQFLLTNKLGNLFNILRNNTKSAYNFLIAELNSNFYKDGQLATPSLKQRIAKIDVGNGVNHIEDYLDCLSSASNYLSSGGSYMGTYIISVLNLVLHTEQWLRWGFVNSDTYYKPVEFGGFPVIEPLSTILCGGISNLYLRVRNVVSAEKYSAMYIDSVVAPPETVRLEEFTRVGSEREKRSLKIDDIVIYKSAGPLGLFQTVRTDRKLSQFERRHGMSKWPIPDKFVTLDKTSSFAGEFLFSVYRSAGMSFAETNLGVNSFYIRFSEPWMSFSRKCYRISMNSPFIDVLGPAGASISHSDIITKLVTLSPAQSIRSFLEVCNKSRIQSQDRIMLAQLTIRLEDAAEVANYLSSQEASEFTHPVNSPTIRKVALKGHEAIDTSSYHLRVVKSLAGEPSEYLINKQKRSLTAFAALDVSILPNPIPLTEAVIQADNTTSLFNKFIRRSTKMTLPMYSSTLSGLIKNILKYKFTENMGVVTSGSMTIRGDKHNISSHNTWMNELLQKSNKFQGLVSKAVLSGSTLIAPKISISSVAPVIMDSETFDFDIRHNNSKYKIVKSTSKDTFLEEVKSWLPTNVTLMFSKPTLDSFVKGKLTFGHDYYTGDGRFFRFAKSKYFDSECNGHKGTHCIEVSKRNMTKGHRVEYKMTYRHIFIFPQSCNGQKVTLTPKAEFQDEEWVKNIMTNREISGEIEENRWYPMSKLTTGGFLRKGRLNYEKEFDHVTFKSITTSTEFEITNRKDSLCVFLKSQNLEFPVTYVNQTSIDVMKMGYTLNHKDIKIAVRDYFHLKTATNNFTRSDIIASPRYKRFLDFVITKSSVETPFFVLQKEKIGLPIETETSVQLDILKTCLISDSKIGVHVAPARLNQFLLNMGRRRNHGYNFISRTITGDIADVDSEAEYEEESEEQFVSDGAIPEAFARNEDLHMDTIVEAEELSEDLPFKMERTEGLSWADEEIVEVGNYDVRENVNTVVTTTMIESQEALFDYTDSESEVLSNRDLDLDLYEEPASNVQLTNDVFGSLNDMLSGIDLEFGDWEGSMSDDADLFMEEVIQVSDLDKILPKFDEVLRNDYGRFVDDKEPTVVSVSSSFTVNPIIENARSMIDYIRGWLDGPGSVSTLSTRNIQVQNISQITQAYVTVCEMIGDIPGNILENLTGHGSIELPVELSALATISEMY